MKRIIQLFICVFLFLIPLNQIKSQSNWKLKGTKNGITVYTMGDENTRLNIIRATFEVEATLSQYASIVLNVEDYKSWNYAAKNPYIIKKISETELIYYAEAEAPWPVTDRYVVLHLKVEQDSQSKILEITLNNVPDQIPKKEGFVRIPVYSSVLKVIPVSKNKVKVELILKVDPGGSIPVWLTNLVSTKIPITTFSNFKKRVKSQGEHRTSVSEISNK